MSATVEIPAADLAELISACRAGPERGGGPEYHLGAAKGRTEEGWPDDEYAAGTRQLQLLSCAPAEPERADVNPPRFARAVTAALPRFDGETFEPNLDGERQENQLEGVRRAMIVAARRIDAWLTIGELRAAAGGSEAGISARIRDLRKARFGGNVIERRRRGDPKRGLFEYRLIERSGS